jgi:N6-adenosine-specific RNA methylase IME4
VTFSSLNPPYSTIVADPPWRYKSDGRMVTAANKASTNPDPNARYSTSTSTDLASLPVSELAAPNAHLYCWTTNPILPEAFALVEAWGFQYVTLLTWRKLGTLGMGYYFRGDTEHVLFAVKGKLPIAPADRKRNWFEARKTGHSIKPASFFDLVETVSPGPYVELFARQPRLGWDAWGLGYEMGAAS